MVRVTYSLGADWIGRTTGLRQGGRRWPWAGGAKGQQRELFVASSEIRALDRNRFDEFAEETLLETEGLRRIHVRGQEEHHHAQFPPATP